LNKSLLVYELNTVVGNLSLVAGQKQAARYGGPS